MSKEIGRHLSDEQNQPLITQSSKEEPKDLSKELCRLRDKLKLDELLEELKNMEDAHKIEHCLRTDVLNYIIEKNNILGNILMFSVVLNVYLILSICHKSMFHAQERMTWQLNEQPLSHEFETMAVSSSSEMCSEFLRSIMFLPISPDVGFMSLYMFACLSVVDPQSVSFQSQIYTSFVDMRRRQCYTEKSIPKICPDDLKTLKRSMRVNAENEFYGKEAHSHVNNEAMVMYMSELFWYHPHRKLYISILVELAKNVDTKQRVPMTARMAKMLNDEHVEHKILFKQFYPNLLNNLHHIHKDGELMKGNPNTIWKIVEVLRKREENGFMNHTFVDSPLNTVYFSDSGEYLACFPHESAFYEVQSAVYIFISKLSMFWRSLDSLRVLPKFYNNMYRSFQHVRDKAMNTLTGSIYFTEEQSVEALYKVYQDRETRKNKRHIETKPPLYEGSFFTISNFHEKKSFAFSATLGSSFGNLRSVNGTIQNNLRSMVGRDFTTVTDHHNLMYPIIITVRDEILLTYAGPGGYSSRSLDFFRSVLSVIYAISEDIDSHKYNLLRLLSYPLFVPLHNPGSFYKDDVINHQFSDVDLIGNRTAKKFKFVDYAALIHGKKSIVLNPSRILPSRPNGL